MAEKMVFNKPEDLRQLVGWVIDDVQLIDGARLVLTLHHIEAPNRIRIIVSPLIQVGMTGNITVHNPALNVASEPAVEELK